MKLLEQVKLVKLPCLFVEFANCVLHFFTLLYVLHMYYLHFYQYHYDRRTFE